MDSSKLKTDNEFLIKVKGKKSGGGEAQGLVVVGVGWRVGKGGLLMPLLLERLASRKGKLGIFQFLMERN
jgi:hypothetical protein